MGTRWWKLLLAVCVVALLVWGCDRIQMIHWVGGTDLEVEFTVTDVTSGGPVPGARVEVQKSEGGFNEEQDKQEFVLVADAAGAAGRECRNSMCFGTKSGLRFTNAFVVHLPPWRFRVVAEGYEPSEWMNLDVPEYVLQVRRAGPGKAKLIVPLSLQKRQAESGAAPDRRGTK